MAQPPSSKVDPWEDDLQRALETAAADPNAMINRSLDLGLVLGPYAEDRFFSIMFERRSKWPTWIIEVRRSSDEQDRRQMTDAFIDTLKRPVRVQIKHSYSQAQNFRKVNRRRGSPFRQAMLDEVTFVVVNSESSDEEIYSEIIRTVQKKFESI